MFYKVLLKSEESLRRVFPTIDHNKPYFLCDLFDQWSIYYFEDSYFYIEKGVDPCVASCQGYPTIYDAGFALLGLRADEAKGACFVEEYGYQFFRADEGIKAVNQIEDSDFLEEITAESVEAMYHKILKQHCEKMQTYVHLGFSKCASTYLQDAIFPNLTNACYLHKDEFFTIFPYFGEEIANHSRQREVFLRKGVRADLEYTPFEPFLDEYNEKIRLLYLKTDHRIFVVSAEELSGEGGVAALKFFENLMPAAKFLFVIREQLNRAESIYIQNVKMGCYRSFKEYAGLHGPRHWSYSCELLRYLHKFGREKLIIWFFEEVILDADILLASLGLNLNVKKIPKRTRSKNLGLSSLLFNVVFIYNKITRRSDKRVNIHHHTKTMVWLYQVVQDPERYLPISGSRFRRFINRAIRKQLLKIIAFREFLFQPNFLSAIDLFLHKLRLYRKKKLGQKGVSKEIVDIIQKDNLILERELGLDLKKHGYLIDDALPD